MAKTDSPALWQSRSPSQLFFTSLLTGHVSAGPSLTLATDVPDLHHFRGNYGGKDIIPLYRDAAAREPNVTAELLRYLAERLGIAVPTPEDLAAYTYALLTASAYQLRFAEALRTPGLRLPLTLDPLLWREAVDQGRHLIWLHSYTERFRDVALGRPAHVPTVDGVGWTEPVLSMPADADAISYDEDTYVLTVGSGRVSGVRPDVWAYSVSGMPVIGKWLGYRTAKPAGRAATSTSALDAMRPVNWPDEWNDELLDLLRVLTVTLDQQAALSDLPDRVCAGPLIAASELPVPSTAERKAPATLRDATFNFE